MSRQAKKITQYIVMLLIIAAIGFIIYITMTKDNKGIVKVGEQAPAFQLKTMDGRTVNLSDYKGKGLILNFWGTWCKPCRKEMPALNKNYEKYKKQGVEVLAIHIKKTPQQVTQFFKGLDEPVRLPIAFDNNNEVSDAFGIDPLPTTVVIDKNGTVKAVHEGEMNSGTIEKYMKSITP
ncbi:thiol-disulfide oxidoreductase ResA [Macrococcus equipercicus]|uniref:Thiol-disulfide oxidoreductase ResA n=1 Tax=Macrococcus equipercicus TaxID=69967 RepID=A0A9Q9BS31_9STAP|nr:thiol-disulfide oxidoreductase ResA [Macrococcus equipercicus]UTH12891.1 thiol-disulfide oxidoreductase ResA [Macrococcus equipercicus]